MSFRLKISLDDLHIARGVAFTDNSCPVALAILEQIPNIDKISVQTETCQWTVRSQDAGRLVCWQANLSVRAQRFINAFDSGCSLRSSSVVRPFRFILEPHVVAEGSEKNLPIY